MVYPELLLLLFALIYPIGLWVIVCSRRSVLIETRPIIKSKQFLGVSIIVVFRDEQDTLDKLSDYLIHLAHSAQGLEVIWVNDHSTDNSYKILESKIVEFPPNTAFLLNCNEEEYGKRSGQRKALSVARYNKLCFLDADCIPSHLNWIQLLHDSMEEDKNMVLVSGLVSYPSPSTFREHLVYGESVMLNGLHSSRSSLSGTSLVYGANMLIQKSVFQSFLLSAKDYEGLAGDDVFLASFVEKHFPGRFCVVTSPLTFVVHKYPPSWAYYIRQRKRWIGKWHRLESWRVRFFSASTGYAQILTFVSPMVFLLPVTAQPSLWVIFLLIKFATEWAILFYFASKLSMPLGIRTFMVLSLAYPIAVAILALSLLRPGITWKGRLIYKR
jgi:cellulose synthase/poly-beta-1,6-N-acetylglucosamine synthase-like glycosyltransferase